MGKKEYHIYVRGKAVPVSEEVLQSLLEDNRA